MKESHLENLGLTAMGNRLVLIACTPQSPSLDDKVKHLRGALNSRGKRSGGQSSVAVDGRS